MPKSTMRILPLLGLALIFLSGCEVNQLRVENERHKRTINQQKKIQMELAEVNSQINAENKNLKQELAKYTSADQSKINDINEKYAAEFNRILQDLKNRTSGTGPINIRQDDRGAIISIAGNVLYQPGKASLSKQGQSILNGVIPMLNEYAGMKISVDGHTDSDKISVTKKNWTSNWHLSAIRATRVAEYLVNNGVESSRLNTTAHAANKPADLEDPNNKTKNRRVEIVLLKNQ